MTETLTPTPGMPATYCIGSDRYAMTVVRVERNGRTLRACFAHAVPDDEDLAVWADEVEARQARVPFVENMSPWHTFTLRSDGRYRAQGATRGSTLHLGRAEDYRDPSF